MFWLGSISLKLLSFHNAYILSLERCGVEFSKNVGYQLLFFGRVSSYQRMEFHHWWWWGQISNFKIIQMVGTWLCRSLITEEVSQRLVSENTKSEILKIYKKGHLSYKFWSLEKQYFLHLTSYIKKLPAFIQYFLHNSFLRGSLSKIS